MIHQTSSIEKRVRHFDVTRESHTAASTTTDVMLRKQLEDELGGPYRQLIGGLVWITNMTSPDTMTTVWEVAKQAHNPTPRHWEVALRVLEYLSATRGLEVRFFKKG